MKKTPDYSNFRILSYHSSLASINFESANLQRKNAHASVSIIIGPNGSGKSTILAQIIDEFSAVYEIRNGTEQSHLRNRLASTAQESATIEYTLDGCRIKISRNGTELQASVNGSPTAIGSVPFPSKALAVAHLPVDKFRFSRAGDSTFYSYLGLRQATNLTTTGALEQKLISSILKGYSRPRFTRHIDRWFNLLGRQQGMGYQGVRLIFRAGDLSSLDDYESFVGFTHEVAKRRAGNSRSISRRDFQSRNGHLLDNVWMLIKSLQQYEIPSASRVRTEFLLNFNDLEILGIPTELIPNAIDSARKLFLLESATLILDRNGKLHNFNELSSGEQQILGTMTRLLTLLESNSIVVIDEPEVSLHPAWQMQYVPTLLETLEDYPSTHVLIATHSHFLVSDVQPQFANLITSSFKDTPVFEPFDGEVYGRSPENILYRVFGVGATGNSYVEQDLARGLAMASGTEKANKNELGKIIDRLSNVSGPDMEAIELILAELRTTFETI